MSGRVLHFRPPVAVVLPEDAARVRRLARRAACALASRTGRPVRLRERRGGSVVSAGVVDHHEVPYRLVATIGTDGGSDFYEATASPEWLLDPSQATEGEFGGEYTNPDFETPGDLLAWVVGSCRRVPKDRVSPGELAAWEERRVLIPTKGDAKKRFVPISLLEAVRIYGPVYRGVVSAEALVENHGISLADAWEIARAVAMVAPGRRQG